MVAFHIKPGRPSVPGDSIQIKVREVPGMIETDFKELGHEMIYGVAGQVMICSYMSQDISV
jgi:hypothetical protein